jgi:hypothetical protein
MLPTAAIGLVPGDAAETAARIALRLAPGRNEAAR